MPLPTIFSRVPTESKENLAQTPIGLDALYGALIRISKKQKENILTAAITNAAAERWSPPRPPSPDSSVKKEHRTKDSALKVKQY